MADAMRRAVAIGGVLLGLTMGGESWAAAFGNPAHVHPEGGMGLGLALSDARETLFFDYGVNERGTLRLLVGRAEFGGADGTEFGAGYRARFDKGFALSEQQVDLGAFGTVRFGEVETAGGSVSYNQLDVGFGGAINPAEAVFPYAAAVYRRISADSGLRGGGGKNRGNRDGGVETDVGLVAGAEFVPGPDFLIGIELHLGFRGEDIALFGELTF